MSAALRRIKALVKLHWPNERLYDKEWEMLESLATNKETVVAAANKVGKDYTAGIACTLFFRYPQFFHNPEYVHYVESLRRPGQEEWQAHTRRILTTSVKEHHLGVLWAEIGRRVSDSAVPLLDARGGPLVLNSLEIRLKGEELAKKPMNYLKGQVAADEQAMAGHHAMYTLFVADEASSLKDEYLKAARGWAGKYLLFGNTEDCRNYFREAVDGGDLA